MQLFNLNGTTNPTHLSIVPSMFKAIPKKTIVAGVVKDGRMAASGLGILDRDDLGVYAIYTDAGERRSGYARAICDTIINTGIRMAHATLTFKSYTEMNLPLICTKASDINMTILIGFSSKNITKGFKMNRKKVSYQHYNYNCTVNNNIFIKCRYRFCKGLQFYRIFIICT